MALVDVFNECHFHEPYLAIQTEKLIIFVIKRMSQTKESRKVCRLCLHVSLLTAFGLGACLSEIQNSQYWQFFRFDNSLYYIFAWLITKSL